MKPFVSFGKSPAHFIQITLTGVALLAPAASAIDWSGTTGHFGTGTNWAGGIVPSGTNATIENGGTATVTTGDVFGVTVLTVGGHSGSGSVTQDGGAVSATQIRLGGDDGGGGTGVGTYSISGGTLTGTGGEMWIGSKGGTGNLQLSGGATVTNNTWIVIGRDGAVGNVTIGGTSELKNTSANIGIGVYSTGKSSSVLVEDSGKLTSANELYVGWGANNTNQGSLTVTDNGLVTVAAGLVVGRDNGKGTMTVSDNAGVNVSGFLVVGADGSGTGDMTISGSSVVNANQMIWIGQNNGTGTLTLNGGTLTGHANTGVDATGAGIAFRGSAGTLNLNGGTLETPGFNRVSGTATLHFNGTSIRATGNTNTGSFFNNFDDSSLSVQSGGLSMDTNGHTLTVTQALSGAGGVTKSGAGTLKLTGVSTFDGPSAVSVGTLLNNGTLGATAVTVGTGAVFGGNGNGTNTVTIAAGGTLAVGDGGIGALTVAAADIDGSLAVELDGLGAGTIDLLNVTGAFDITNASVSFTHIGAALDDASYVFASYGSLVGSAFASEIDLPSGYEIDYAFGGNFIALVAIPEPASTMLGGLGLLALFRRRRA
jgi:PEP-CTERM motif